MDKVIFQCAGTTAEVQRAQDVTQPGILLMMIMMMLIAQTTCSGSGTIFFFQRSLYLGLKLLKIKFKDIVYEYPCNTHEIFYQILKININLNFLIVNKIVAGC